MKLYEINTKIESAGNSGLGSSTFVLIVALTLLTSLPSTTLLVLCLDAVGLPFRVRDMIVVVVVQRCMQLLTKVVTFEDGDI